MSSKKNVCIIQNQHKQCGAALCTSLIFLTILTVLGLSSMRSTTLGTKTAVNHQFKQMSFQAAENALFRLTGKDRPDVLLPGTSTLDASVPVQNINYFAPPVSNQGDTSADLEMSFIERSPPGKYKFSGFGLSIVTIVYQADAFGKTDGSKSRAHNRMQVALLRD